MLVLKNKSSFLKNSILYYKNNSSALSIKKLFKLANKKFAEIDDTNTSEKIENKIQIKRQNTHLDNDRNSSSKTNKKINNSSNNKSFSRYNDNQEGNYFVKSYTNSTEYDANSKTNNSNNNDIQIKKRKESIYNIEKRYTNNSNENNDSTNADVNTDKTIGEDKNANNKFNDSSKNQNNNKIYIKYKNRDNNDPSTNKDIADKDINKDISVSKFDKFNIIENVTKDKTKDTFIQIGFANLYKTRYVTSRIEGNLITNAQKHIYEAISNKTSIIVNSTIYNEFYAIFFLTYSEIYSKSNCLKKYMNIEIDNSRANKKNVANTQIDDCLETNKQKKVEKIPIINSEIRLVLFVNSIEQACSISEMSDFMNLKSVFIKNFNLENYSSEELLNIVSDKESNKPLTINSKLVKILSQTNVLICYPEQYFANYKFIKQFTSTKGIFYVFNSLFKSSLDLLYDNSEKIFSSLDQLFILKNSDFLSDEHYKEKSQKIFKNLENSWKYNYDKHNIFKIEISKSFNSKESINLVKNNTYDNNLVRFFDKNDKMTLFDEEFEKYASFTNLNMYENTNKVPFFMNCFGVSSV